MPQIGGKDSRRHFTVVMKNKKHGLYVSSTPSSAAKKAVTKLCAANKSKKVIFHIREITQGSKKKIYGPYLGYIEKLKEPIELKGRIIRYKPIVKLSDKKITLKKGGMIGGGGGPSKLAPTSNKQNPAAGLAVVQASIYNFVNSPRGNPAAGPAPTYNIAKHRNELLKGSILEESFSRCTGLTTLLFDTKHHETKLIPVFSNNKEFNFEKRWNEPFVSMPGNNNLESITVQGHITKIGHSAFSGCEKLEKMNLEDSVVKTLVSQTFSYCIKLSQVSFPPTMVQIGDWSFWECKNLANVDFSKCSNLISIGNAAFKFCKIKNLDLSNCTKLELIETDAFSNNTELVEVKMPPSIKIARSHLFCDCKNLKSIDLSMCTEIKTLESYMFAESGLENILLPPNLESIEYACFRNCPLESIQIPKTVKEFSGSFYGCKNLKKILFEGNISKIKNMNKFKRTSSNTQLIQL